MTAEWSKYTLNFKRPGGTSRGVLREKTSWFIRLTDDGNTGIGECGLLKGLSCDDRDNYEQKLQEVCANPVGFARNLSELADWPSIRFGLEMALKDLKSSHHVLFPGGFTDGSSSITTNGLIWMGDPDFMESQIADKLQKGFGCIKLKIGAIDFDREIELLKGIRKRFNSKSLELRVDANGAFSPSDAPSKLDQLAKLDIHSIEQPIRAGQWHAMAQLCANSPVDIALDEELIGINKPGQQKELVDTIRPQYLILKPSLLGGFAASETWINLAAEFDAGWWVTSALESNLGLNAIAQWTFGLKNPLPQGLGTGQLFTNNFRSPLYLDGENLKYDPLGEWEIPRMEFNRPA